MHITIYTPTIGAAESRYVLEYFFSTLFQQPFSIIQEEERKHFTLKMGEKCLHLPAHFFIRSSANWGEMLAVQPQERSNSFSNQFLSLFGESGHFSMQGIEANFDLDVFGSSFYFLSGYEEFTSKEGDHHQRFLAEYSWRNVNNWLFRPFVNEYLEVFQKVLSHFFEIDFTIQKSFTQYLSCDVDIPYAPYLYSNKKFLKTLAGDVLKRGEIRNAIKKIKEKIHFNKKGKDADPNHTFYEYFLWQEKYEVALEFYFIPKNIAGKIDEDYHILDIPVRQILYDVHAQGAEIGIHTSYAAYNDVLKYQEQKNTLEQALDVLNIHQSLTHNRNHYLRWDVNDSITALESAQMLMDATLGFADHIGFRRGICYSFPLYHLRERRKSSVMERPLLIMDVSLLGKSYMHLSYDAAEELCIKIKKDVLRYQGDFTVLWHNSNLTSSQDIQLVEKILSY